ncbi:MAG TPA: hypothetical protein DD670_10735 [Planctomycetaceae bacterium]|nr:hypothetical protein [Planctomycetaceae bacterium]
MKHQLTIAMYILLLLVGTIAADTSAFEILQYPGAINTWPEDIRDGVIVGRYRDNSSVIHGFVYDGSTYSKLDFPGSSYTTLSGTDGTNIVGVYFNSANQQRGFLFDGNSFTTIAPTDTSTTLFNGACATGVDGQTIVGSYYNSLGKPNGFVFDGAIYSTFGFSTGGTYAPEDIEGNNIAGSCFGQGPEHGFLYDGETTLSLFYPADNTLATRATAVSGNRVVGYYYESSSLAKHSFIYEQGDYSMYDVPASLGEDTEIRGIDGDKIVGYYIGTSGAYYGFVTTIPEPCTLQLLMTICLCCLMVRRPATCILSRRCASHR